MGIRLLAAVESIYCFMLDWHISRYISSALFVDYCAYKSRVLCVWMQSLSMNSDMSRLAINGHTKQGVEKLVDRIGYVNSHTKPLVGHSTVTFDTVVT